MVKEDHKRGSINHVHGKAFPVISNKLNGLFSKTSLRIHQTYTKEKSYSKHGFKENLEDVFVRSLIV